jgi:O-antigen ligase/tRNA A-37 threonylcarbamoyl transferase component Bud32
LYDDADLRNAHAFSRDGSRLGSVPSLFTESPVYLVWNASARVIVKAGASVIESVRVHAPGARSLVFRKTSRSFGLSPVNMPHAYSPEALDASGDAVVLRDRRNKVWHLPDPSGGGGRLVVKRVRIAGAHKRLIQRWRPGRALMSWNGAQELLRRGIPTPAPVAFDQPHDKLKDGHYVCRYVTPDASMRQVFEGLKRGRKHFLRIDDSTWYQSLAEFISNMHRRGVYFRDLSPGNILVVRRDDGCPGFTLIDTARARFHSHAVSAACRLRDLRRALHPLHWAGRKRFLAIYAEHSGMKYSAAMLWPLLRYDIKHYLKDRIRGRRPWFGPLPEDGLWKANLPRGERTHEEPGRDTAFIRTVRSLLDRPVIRAGGALAIALACWTGPSRFSHFLVAVGLAAAALLVKPKGFRVWKSPVGPAMAAVYLVPLLLLPLGVAPGVSGREMAKLLPLVAAGLAIPVLFNSPPAAGAAMSWSACAATLYLGIDLIRLAIQVGPAMTDARYAEPYLMIHPNVSSIMAAAAFFVLSARAWSWRKRPALAAAAALGAAVDLAYLLAMASRGPQLAFALACAAFVAVLPTTRQKLVWALILATGISICASQMERINPRFAEGDVFSLNERTTVWRHAWSLAKAHPVIGYGYGKKVFQRVYYGSNPPEAGFEFPHPHNYWLKVLFESGWVGVTCHLLLWTAVISVLLRRLRRERTLDGRLWPGTVFLLAVLLIAYGLGDFPDNMAKVLMMWIPGLALAAAGPVQPTRPG